MVFNIQTVSFTLVQLITASSASSPTVPKERRSLNLKASSTGSASSPTVPKGPSPNRIFIPSLTHPALKEVFCFRGYFFCFCLFFLPCLCFCLFRVFPCPSVSLLLLFLAPGLCQLCVCGVPFLAAYLPFYFSDKKLLRM